MIQSIYVLTKVPMSVIIVGIGNEDFGLMDELDSDETSLKKEDGTEMERDIVQFVRFFIV